MSGDYSRWSFDPARHFEGVLQQQGRVHTDADFNEWVSTMLRRVAVGTLDTVGQATVPRETPDGFKIAVAGGKLTIGPGRIYVDGILAENEGHDPRKWDPHLAELRGTAPTPYAAQPYRPSPPALPSSGPHLVYLKMWRREVSAIEDPRLVEQALGVDTTTRLQTVWQVKLLERVDPSVTCSTPLDEVPGFAAVEPVAAGRLTTDLADVAGVVDPCLVPPSGGYKGLENQTYRIEIHKGGGLTGPNRATFKWSRDNATVASRVTEIPALDHIVVESVGRDDLLRFSDGDWVEVTDDARELAGLSGELRRIQTAGGVEDATGSIRLTKPLTAGLFPVDAQGHTSPGRNTRVRRWDQHGRVLDAGGNLVVDLDAAAADGAIPVTTGAVQVVLENGVGASFSLDAGGGAFRTGDHWLFAARTADASVELLDKAPPHGVHVHYAKLALVTFPGSVTDCRTLWPPPPGTAEEDGCECTVCVTEESHASGSLTIQMGIDQASERGGTVCLEAGVYALKEPVRIEDARSIRLRGQGLASVLVASSGGAAVAVRGMIDVRIEDLAVVSAAVDRVADAVTITNSVDVAIVRCFVLAVPGEAGPTAAIGLAGAVLGTRIEHCALAASTGIAGWRPSKKGDKSGFLLTASLRIERNWMWCLERGVDLTQRSIHLADTSLAANTIWGCRDVAISALGGNLAGPFEIARNALLVRANGIVSGVADVRIADNDVTGPGERRSKTGDGIALETGLDPRPTRCCEIRSNRLDGLPNHGIAIRHRIGSGQIAANVITRTGLGGIVMEDDGSGGRLAVRDNQLEFVCTGEEPRGNPVAIRMVAVDDLEVAGNSVLRFALAARQVDRRTGLLALGCLEVRVAGNRLAGVGPPDEYIGSATAIEVTAPLASVGVHENSVSRIGDHSKVESADWTGVRIRSRGRDEDELDRFFTHGELAVLGAGDRAFVFTATNAFIYEKEAGWGDVTLNGNEIVANQTEAWPLAVTGVRGCRMIGNRVDQPESDGHVSLLQCRRAIVSSNDLRSGSEADVLEVLLIDTEEAAIVGNMTTGPITVDGNSLSSPWADLNPIIFD